MARNARILSSNATFRCVSLSKLSLNVALLTPLYCSRSRLKELYGMLVVVSFEIGPDYSPSYPPWRTKSADFNHRAPIGLAWLLNGFRTPFGPQIEFVVIFCFLNLKILISGLKRLFLTPLAVEINRIVLAKES